MMRSEILLSRRSAMRFAVVGALAGNAGGQLMALERGISGKALPTDHCSKSEEEIPCSTSGSDVWKRAWNTCPRPSSPPSLIQRLALESIKGQTVRQRLSLTLGGRGLRLRFSNEYGDENLLIGGASVSLVMREAEDRRIIPVTFDGQSSVELSPGTFVLSDTVALKTLPQDQLEVSLFIPKETEIFDGFEPAQYKSVHLSPLGDFTNSIEMPRLKKFVSRRILTAVDVLADYRASVVVVLGDSITEGSADEVNWPAHLAQRLRRFPGQDGVAVINAGIGGNQLLRNGFGEGGLARFDRDVLAVPGATHVIVSQGINDIGLPGAANFGGKEWIALSELPSLEKIVFSYGQLVTRAHDFGLKAYGGTLTPFRGKAGLSEYNADAKERLRCEVNNWIRSSGVFDAVIDFDAALRDPAKPILMDARYDSGDGLHPNEIGNVAMASSINLSLFD